MRPKNLHMSTAQLVTGGPRDHTLRYTDLLTDNLLQSHCYNDQQHALQMTIPSPPPSRPVLSSLDDMNCLLDSCSSGLTKTPRTPFPDQSVSSSFHPCSSSSFLCGKVPKHPNHPFIQEQIPNMLLCLGSLSMN